MMELTAAYVHIFYVRKIKNLPVSQRQQMASLQQIPTATAWGSNRCILWESYEKHENVVMDADGTHIYHSAVGLTHFVLLLYYFMKKHFGSENVKQTVRPSVR